MKRARRKAGIAAFFFAAIFRNIDVHHVRDYRAIKN